MNDKTYTSGPTLSPDGYTVEELPIGEEIVIALRDCPGCGIPSPSGDLCDDCRMYLGDDGTEAA